MDVKFPLDWTCQSHLSISGFIRERDSTVAKRPKLAYFSKIVSSRALRKQQFAHRSFTVVVDSTMYDKSEQQAV